MSAERFQELSLLCFAAASYSETLRRLGRGAQAPEIAAGSGDLSQSEPLAFFGYAAKNRPKAIEVLWPDGTRKSCRFTAGVPRIPLTKGP